MDPLPSEPAPRTGARALSLQALPVGLFYLTQVLLGLTDLAVVAALGEIELAAVGLARTVVFSFLAAGFAVLSAALVLLAEDATARSRSEVFAATLSLAGLLALAGLGLHRAAPAALEAGGYAVPLAHAFSDYTRLLVWLVVPAAAYATLKNVLVAAGRTRALTVISAATVTVNLGASVVLVHGAGPLPGLGVTGAAVATVLVSALAAVVLRTWCVRLRLLTPPTVRLSSRRLAAHARAILRLGWPAGVQQAFESLLFVLVLFLLGTFSRDWLVAGSIAFAVMEIDYVIGMSLGEVTAAQVARLGAERDRAGQRRLARDGAVACTVTTAVLAVAVFVAAPSVVGLFARDGMSETTLELVAEVLRWTCPCFAFDTLQVHLTHTLRAIRCTVPPMAIGLATYWGIGLGGGLALAHIGQLGAPGLWGGFCVALVVAGASLGALASLRFGRATS